MSKITVEVTSNVDKFTKELRQAMERALEAVGGQAEGDVALITPVDTGRLRGSITHRVSMDEECVYVGTNVEYAAYVELGTSKMKKPKPYLKPGIMNNKDSYMRIIKDYLSG